VTWYELLLFVHIVSVIVWLGGGFCLQLLGARVRAAGDPERTARFGRDVAWIGSRVFSPSSLLALVSGILLVVEGNWDWGEPYVSVGLLVWLVSFLVGVGFLGPTSRKVAELVEREGPASAEAARRMGQVFLYSRIELVLLVVVVFMMVVKLGT
jgi:uncharacterized membrane protein